MGQDDTDPGRDDAQARLHREFDNVLAAVIGSLNVLARRHADDSITQAVVMNALYGCSDLKRTVEKILQETSAPS